MLTTGQVAQRVGCSAVWIKKLAARHDVGTRLTPTMRVYSETEAQHLAELVAQSKAGPRGRPTTKH